MSEKNAYCKTLEDCLEKWSKKMSELESAAEIAEGPTKVDC